MGNACSGKGGGSPEDTERQRAIEKMLRQDRNKLEKEIKLLLLGAGQSGKSTLAKQMKIIYLTGFTDDERAAFREIVNSNVYTWGRELVEGVEAEGLSLTPENQQNISSGFLDDPREEMSPAIATLFKKLWADPAVRSVHDHGAAQVGDSAPYFFESLDRIADSGYVPTTDDVLRVRVKTTGISEICFTIAEVNFRMVDVGGQRSERRKWIHCFQDVTAVIFFVAMSEYNQVLAEDSSVNRMHESIALFDEIVNSRWFDRSAIILFLNKSDLFKEKIQKVDLKCLFEDYDGGCNYEAGCQFLTSVFMNLVKDPAKQVYAHVTCATNTQNIRLVFNSVRQALLVDNMKEIGIEL